MFNFLWKVGNWLAKWKGGVLHLRIMTCSSFWIKSYLNLPSQELFDHLKGDYVRDS